MKKIQPKLIIPYDTTLRDGGQDPRINFSLSDKIAIYEKLSSWGIPFIEGGWPGANPTDINFFKYLKTHRHPQTIITAFGMTRRKGVQVKNDPGLKLLLDAATDIVTLVGKGSAKQAQVVLGVEVEENIEIITDSIRFLRNEGRKVMFDAEHFFKGYEEDPKSALKIIKAAADSGAQTIVLCDTANGTPPSRVFKIVKLVHKFLSYDIQLGIHTHNDGESAVASSLAALEAGATQVQGSFNGYGERTGNASLVPILVNAVNKYGFSIPDIDLTKSREVAEFIAAIAKVPLSSNTPFVGDDAYTHKAGMHADAILKMPDAYNNIDPELVGNRMKFVSSDQGGSANVLSMAQKHRFKFAGDNPKRDPRVKQVVWKMKQIQVLGDVQEYLVLHEVFNNGYHPFDVHEESLVTTSRTGVSQAHLKVRVNGSSFDISETGKGAFDAFNKSLRSGLTHKYQFAAKLHLIDYSVVLPPNQKPGTDALVDVTITFELDGEILTSKARNRDEQLANQNALIDAYMYTILRSKV